jgi:putative nucleotidyltransferase with HDIG domain
VPADNLTRIRGFAGFVTALAVAGVAVGWAAYGLGPWKVLVVLAVAAWIAEGRAMPVSATRKLELSVVFIPIVMAAVLFGPASGGLVGLAGMLADRRGPIERFAIYAASRTLGGVMAGAVAVWVGDAVGRTTLLDVLAATLAAGLAFVAVDLLSTTIVASLRGLMSPREVWYHVRTAELLTMALYTPLTALYAYAYDGSGAQVLAFIAIPLLAARLSYSLYARQNQLIAELTDSNTSLEDANRRLRRVNLSFAASMVRALDARDAYTAGHSAAVAVYSRDIARELSMPDHEIDLVHLTGLVHDIGKIGVRAEVLEKTSALNDDEWAEMRRHSEIGASILVEVEDYQDVAAIVRSHHERFDGAGYPDGLAREEIPLLARIISVADAYNAMTTKRPYRDAMPPDVAIQQLLNGRGSQFQADLVDAFVRVLEREHETYRLGVKTDFSLESMQHQELTPPPAVPSSAAA